MRLKYEPSSEQEMRSTVAYHAALEVVTDLLILSCAERLIGLVMSQIARVATGVLTALLIL